MTLDYNVTGGFKSKKKLSSILPKSQTQKLHNSGHYSKILKKKNPHQKQRTSTYGNNLQLQYKTKKICCRALRYLISLNPAVINLPFISRQCYNLTFEMETNAMASWIRNLKIHLKSLHSIQSLRNLLTAARMLL